MAGSMRDPPPPSLDHRPQRSVAGVVSSTAASSMSPSRIGRGGGGTRGGETSSTAAAASFSGSYSASASSTASQRLVVPRTPPASARAKMATASSPSASAAVAAAASTPSTVASTPGGNDAAANMMRPDAATTTTARTAGGADLHVRIVSSNHFSEDGGMIVNDHGAAVSSSIHQLLEVKYEDLMRREEEMWHVARTFAVPPARWNGSRLYQCYQHEMKERADRNKYHTRTSPANQQQSKPVVLFLDPVAFCCREQHLSSVFRWRPWLGEMMQSYLKTGILTVHKDATGDDWLLCCEFFSVLYQPSQVVFETLQAYQNVSSWSDYLSKRCDLAEWIADHVLRLREGVFVVTHAQDNGWAVEVDQLPQPATAFVDVKSAVLPLTDFFHDDDHPVDRETRQVRMRSDFCGYLEHVMSHVHCRFDMELVTLTNQVQRFAPRAVLRVRMLLHPPPPPVTQPKKTRSALPFPLDELVAEDLQAGRLENLVKTVDARNPSAILGSSKPTESPLVEPTMLPTEHVPPATATETGVAPAVDAGDEARTQNHSMAMASVKAHQTLMDGLPFNVIRTISTGEGNQSVTSALTGPFLFDEDGIMREPSEFYDAAVVAAAGGSGWRSRPPGSRSGHVKALADDDTTKSPEVGVAPRDRKDASAKDRTAAPTQGTDPKASTQETKPEEEDEKWDWLTNLCQVSASFLSKGTGQSPLAGEADKVAADEADKVAADEAALKKAHESKRMAKLAELQTKAAESRSQKVPGSNRIDAQQEEMRVVSLHRVDDADATHKNTDGVAAGAGVTAPSPQRAGTPEAARDNLSRSTDSSNGGRDRPEPSAKVQNRRGHESQASSTVSASLQPKSDHRTQEAQKRFVTPKRRVLKGFFRRNKPEV